MARRRLGPRRRPGRAKPVRREMRPASRTRARTAASAAAAGRKLVRDEGMVGLLPGFLKGGSLRRDVVLEHAHEGSDALFEGGERGAEGDALAGRKVQHLGTEHARRRLQPCEIDATAGCGEAGCDGDGCGHTLQRRHGGGRRWRREVGPWQRHSEESDGKRLAEPFGRAG